MIKFIPETRRAH